MLFGLNTVSVLTLIDVPVCFPLLLRTEITRRSGYYRLGEVRQKQPSLQRLAHHSLLCLFHLSGFRESKDKKVEVNRLKKTDKEIKNKDRGE